MQCKQIKQLIPEYIEGRLKGDTRSRLESHLTTCRGCREETRLMGKTWLMLSEVDDIKPDPHYISRFWSAVDSQQPWYEKIFRQTKELVSQRRWVPALAAAGVILIVGGITLRYHNRVPETETVVAAFNEVDPDMVESIDIIENLELIQDIDFYTDLEIIENLDESETS